MTLLANISGMHWSLSPYSNSWRVGSGQIVGRNRHQSLYWSKKGYRKLPNWYCCLWFPMLSGLALIDFSPELCLLASWDSLDLLVCVWNLVWALSVRTCKGIPSPSSSSVLLSLAGSELCDISSELLSNLSQQMTHVEKEYNGAREWRRPLNKFFAPDAFVGRNLFLWCLTN